MHKKILRRRFYISDGAKHETVITDQLNRSLLYWDNDTGLAPTIL